LSRPYTIEITAGVLDEFNVPLDNPQSATFTTSGPPALEVRSISPPSGPVAITAVIGGTGFDPNPANNIVTFTDNVPAVVTAAGEDFLEVTVPLDAASGPVQVEVGGVPSNTVDFAVLIPLPTPIDDIIANVGTPDPTRGIGVTPDRTRAYALSPDANLVVEIDIENLVAGPTIRVDESPSAIVIDHAGHYAYVTNLLSGTVSVIDVDPLSPDYRKVVKTLRVGAAPTDLAIHPDGDRVYVANAGSNYLSIVDTDETSKTFNQIVGNVPTPDLTRSIAVTPDRTRLYLGTDKGYVIMSTVDYGVIGVIDTGAATRSVSVTPNRTMLVLLTTEGQVAVFDIAPNSPTENEIIGMVGGPDPTRSVSVTPDRLLAYLVQEQGDIILVVSLEVPTSVSALDAPANAFELAVVDTLTAGEDPSHVVFAADRVLVTNAGDNTITVFGIPSVAGQVLADGSGLENVTVDAFSGGELIDGFVSDDQGNYIGGLPPGEYTITVVTPLGYTAATEEVPVTVESGVTAFVDFGLTAASIFAQPRGAGYWKHQVGVALGGKGKAQIDGPTLCGYLDDIADHFNSNIINEVIVYQPPASGLCGDKLLVAKDLLNLKGQQAMIARAKQQLMGLLFNVAAQYISLTEVISEDGATVSQAITWCDWLIDDGIEGNDVTAMSIAAMVNGSTMVPEGEIPLETPHIAYSPNGIHARRQTHAPRRALCRLAGNHPSRWPGCHRCLLLPDRGRNVSDDQENGHAEISPRLFGVKRPGCRVRWPGLFMGWASDWETRP
jgi:YVTN family beta-propeller protein